MSAALLEARRRAAIATTFNMAMIMRDARTDLMQLLRATPIVPAEVQSIIDDEFDFDGDEPPPLMG